MPASYHTVSLQFSQDVSTTALLTLLYLISYILTSIRIFILVPYIHLFLCLGLAVALFPAEITELGPFTYFSEGDQ